MNLWEKVLYIKRKQISTNQNFCKSERKTYNRIKETWFHEWKAPYHGNILQQAHQ